MKKIWTVFVILMALLICGCSAQSEPEPPKTIYDDVVARLEAGDYDGARFLIDVLEAREASETAPAETWESEMPVQAETTSPAAEPDSVVAGNFEIVELTEYNARDYLTFEETFYIADKSGCSQYVTLKKEYRDRLISVENVNLQVTFLHCQAYGQVDLQAGEFLPEYYDSISEKQMDLELDRDGTGWISRMLYYSKKGYFPDYAMDVVIKSASGRLILSAE